MNKLCKKEKNNTGMSCSEPKATPTGGPEHKRADEGSEHLFRTSRNWIPGTSPRMTQYEYGRSMVEMLGMLAVIGVLSVGGVAMYTNAMNKHKANEILNEASKRAVMVAAQAMTGKTGEISLSEFGSNTVSGVTFSKAEIKENHIVLTLSGSGLADNCAQLKNATGDNTVMKITQDDCSELTFNADMTVGNSDGNESAEQTPPACDPACTGGCQQCNGGKCISTCKIGEYCMSNSNSDFECVAFKKCNNSSECPKKAPCCSNNACVVNTCSEGSEWYQYGPSDYGCKDINNTITSGTCSSTIKGCSSNSDCDTPNEFCFVDHNWSCSEPLSIGQCTPVGIVNTVFGKTGNAAQYNGYIYSSIKMNWWSANNWCEAQGKRLVSLSDLGIIGGYEGGWCTLNTCQGADWDALYDAFGHEYWWTTERRDSDSCEVFYIETTTSYQAPVQTTSILGEQSSLCL